MSIAPGPRLMCYFRKALYCFVFIGFSSSFAGSYDDFFVAIKQDDADTVRALLKRGFDPNTRNPAGEHGLALAIREPSQGGVRSGRNCADRPGSTQRA